MNQTSELKMKVLENVGKVIIGKEKEIELLLIAFLSEGHILLEDLPGMGKTMMVRSFSKTLELPFKRIQFTPDLLPGDITGVSFYNQKTRDFEFREGPLFSNVILADEINRATPRTQSALLEAMEERQITVDGETRRLKKPFMVLATQNPIESYGTFPLPEAQMDRFLMRIRLGYPSKSEEKIILLNTFGEVLEELESVSDMESIFSMMEEIRKVTITDEVMEYLLDIVHATRESEEISLGVSPRGSIALYKAAQVKASLEGRDYIMPEDIQEMAPYTLNHRILLDDASSVEECMARIKAILSSIKVPLENLEES
ncbi:MoxR family ATPase [Proteiniclasticum sp. SCR006]|uniref:MoxR family ATPase n=1 Tax=Proteiniclasticum aestuarii TaxID=2817862 RepID=A0A939H7R8_9CLOT|nr:MoxR family ATPase [Proteiniclasticum aestuarii]MBO1265862.1 MoxR family ATPase [Proteiniclasticum aestuarii]